MMKLNKRILSALLAVILLMTNFPVISAASDSFAIHYGGKAVTEVEFSEHERITVSAEGNPGDACQWQIQIPGTDQWVNIQGQTGQTINLSKAVVGSLTVDGSACVRCAAIRDGEEIGHTAPLRTAVKKEENPIQTPAAAEPAAEGIKISTQMLEIFGMTAASAQPEAAAAAPTEAAAEETTLLFAATTNADGASTDETEATADSTQIVKITIDYIYWDRVTDEAGEKTWDSYEAYIQKGTDFSVEVPNKTVPGYQPELGNAITGVTLTTNDSTKASSVTISLVSVQEDVTVTVYYKEVQVPYYARYFLQNVYNDLYVEDTTMYKEFSGYQNSDPQLDGEGGIYQEKYGFTALFHQPDKIAADGSTVFEVYYDRNYYLINFDMDGGYGTAPVYARYETTFTVADPTNPGHTFASWTEDITKRAVNADGSADEDAAFVAALDAQITALDKVNGRVTKIPFSNLTYEADWTQQSTTYKVAYWILNDNGKKTYLGSTTNTAQSGTTASGEDDLAGKIICGIDEHTHGDTCTTCDHVHTRENCYNGTNAFPMVNPSTGEINVLNAFGTGEPTNGYAYKIVRSDDASYTRYFIPYRDDSNSSTIHWHYSADASCLYGSPIATATYTSGTATWTAEKYVARPACGHAHGENCSQICNIKEHTHTSDCQADTNYMEFVEEKTLEIDGENVTFKTDKNLTVEGDGSTVVNVYYQYKEYTLRFYYARTKGGQDGDDADEIPDSGFGTIEIVGGSTYRFGNSGSDATTDDSTLLDRVEDWGTIQSLPTLKNDKDYVKGALPVDDYYYHYIEFTARYGDDITNKWPHDVFNNATRTDVSSQASGWEGTAAVLSAWNGEQCVKYSQDVGNQTIKGVYEKLDDMLLIKDGFEDESTVSFLAFWENGANVSWSVPELYVYNMWVPYQGNDFDSIEESKKRTKNGVNYYLYRTYNTCDNSTIGEQTSIPIAGYTENKNIRGWSAYFIGSMWTTDQTKYYVTSNWNNELKYDGTYVYSGSWSYPEQGETANVAIKELDDDKYLLYTTDGAYTYDPDNPGEVINHTLYREAYAVDFYYKANGPYTLQFLNHNDWLGSGEGVEGGVYYGASLRKYFEGVTVNGTKYDGANDLVLKNYPSTLEPDAYEFEGWYTTSECLPGTKVDWETMTMPDSALTVYAHWIPKTYNTYFYLDYEKYLDEDVYKTVEDTPHGTPMTETVDIPTHPTGGDKYRFTGWFYIDGEGEKTAFNPAEMAVRQELHLYAEWTTSVSVSYTVHYVLGDQDGNVVTDSDGNPYQVADDKTGYGFEATTRTFDAKAADELNLLSSIPEDVRKQYVGEFSDPIWLPNTSSHSILLKPLDDGGSNPNEFTFVYTAKQYAPYTVRYLDATTGASLRDDKVEQYNTSAVVTEQFCYVPGYIPDAFNKRLILSANDEENVLTFYYTKDESYVDEDDDGNPETQSARYLVTHYVQNVDRNGYTVYTSDDLLGEVGDEITVEALTLQGFTYNAGETQKAPKNTGNTVDGNGVTGKITSGKDGEEALEIELYYKRDSFKYTVQYLELGTENELQEAGGGKAYYQSVITATAPEIAGYEVYLADDNTAGELSLTISYEESKNVITFYYTAIPVTIHYHAVLQGAVADSFGVTSRNKETPVDQILIAGAQAIPQAGFQFMGWYSDEACENKVSDDASYKPTIDFGADIYEYHYYALFEPITLTIVQAGMTNATDSGIYEVVNSSDQVIARVMITGNSSVTLEQVPAGTYTIREVSGNWTWTYNGPADGNLTVTVKANPGENDNKVTFTQVPISPIDWLHSETHR